MACFCCVWAAHKSDHSWVIGYLSLCHRHTVGVLTVTPVTSFPCSMWQRKRNRCLVLHDAYSMVCTDEVKRKTQSITTLSRILSRICGALGFSFFPNLAGLEQLRVRLQWRKTVTSLSGCMLSRARYFRTLCVPLVPA